MLKIGVTGGIGSGKSTVCHVFRVLGVPVFDSDAMGKRLLAEDPGVRAAVVREFGPAAYAEGAPDRAFLARAVFSDPAARTRLNAIVHPAVRQCFQAWAMEHDAPYVLMESAVLVGSGGGRGLDGLVLVSAPPALRLERAMRRDGADERSVRGRMAAQDDEQAMRAAADHEIVNDDRRPVIPQVLETHRLILQRAGA